MLSTFIAPQELALTGIKYNVSLDLYEQAKELMNGHHDAGDSAVSKMQSILDKAKEDMKAIIPTADLSSLCNELASRISKLEKKREQALKDLSADVSEMDSMRAVMRLQSRVIAGDTLEGLLGSLNDARDLLALCDLAQQTGNNALADKASYKAEQIATGGAGDEAAKLKVALSLIEREQEAYKARWANAIDRLGRS